MRADARRNRERIVAGAVEVFSAHGPTASMEDVARAAGVGVGTLYRHFPDRSALARDVTTGALADLLDHASAVAGHRSTGWEKLRDITRHCVGLPLALAKTLGAQIPVAERPVELSAEIDAVLAAIAEEGRIDGSIRADLQVVEVVQVISAVVCRPGATFDDALARVLLDGLRKAP